MPVARTLDLDSLQLVLGCLENEKGLLFHMSLLNKQLYSLALPLLYRFNTFRSLTRASKFCQALHNHSQSPARFVQKLYIMHITQSSKRAFWTEEAAAFAPLVHRTLPLFPNLQHLSITGTGFEIQQPLSHLPFSLESFSLLLPINAPLLEFLQTQKSLKHLGLCSPRLPFGKSDCLDPKGMTGEALLPNLSSLVSCPANFATLAPGRPINHATVHRCETHRWSALVPNLISGIDQSAGPIQTLRVDLGSVRDTRCVEFVASLGNTKAASTLEMLNLIPTGLASDNDYWMPPGGKYSGSVALPPQLFSALSALRLLVIEKPIRGPEDEIFIEELGEPILPAEPEYDSIWSHAEAKELWRVNCPKLTSVWIYDKRLDLGA